jgi:DNA-directed RNA polymerase subunit B
MTDFDEITTRDMMSVLISYVNDININRYNIESFDNLLNNGLNQIGTMLYKDVTRTFSNKHLAGKQNPEKDRKSIEVRINITSVEVKNPVTPDGKNVLMPNESRLKGIPYMAPVYMGFKIDIIAHYEPPKASATKTVIIPPFEISKFPIMKGSCKCNTYKLPPSVQKNIGECPRDINGYFIIKGEWIVDNLENIAFNVPHIHIRKDNSTEQIRGEFISKPPGIFEHSSQLKISYMKNGQILVSITSNTLSQLQFPFYVIFKVLGVCTDRDIAELIVYDLDSEDPHNKKILDILCIAFSIPYSDFEDCRYLDNRKDLITIISKKAASSFGSAYASNVSKALERNKEARRYLNNTVIDQLDSSLLPHVGKTEADRYEKAKMLALIIRKCLLVKLGVMKPTDRDSYRNKRCHDAGMCLTKAAKTFINPTIINPIFDSIYTAIKNGMRHEHFTDDQVKSMVQVQLVSNTKHNTLSHAIIQTIITGNTKINLGKKMYTVRVASRGLERKNILNTISSARSIATHNEELASKQSERAEKMRRVNASMYGYVCVVQSADTGSKVGVVKQLALTTYITGEQSYIPIRDAIYDYSDFIKTTGMDLKKMYVLRWAKVFLHGKWLGCCVNSVQMVKTFREMRRAGKINKYVTIYWDINLNEVHFLIDGGRLTRPLIIVDNNYDEYEKKNVEFEQYPRITMEHINDLRTGKIKLQDLIKMQVCEYISVEESENCLLAYNIEHLKKHRNNPKIQFTHLDIEQAVFGFPALVSPYANHTQAVRVTYETNQSKQTCGFYALNFPYRYDINKMFQFQNQLPLTPTITHKFIPSNGMNVMTSYMIYCGFNQEDSAIFSKAYVDRGGYCGVFFKYEKLELTSNEDVRSPELSVTKNAKAPSAYEKLGAEGIVPVGTPVVDGDVIVHRVERLSGTKGDHFHFVDKSVVYRGDECAIVDMWHKHKNLDGTTYVSIKLKMNRPMRVGDKMSSRAGNKAIVALLLPYSELPYADDGTRPDKLVNTHSIPTRMIIGEIMECTNGIVCAKQGALQDATAFTPVDLKAIHKKNMELGGRFSCLTTMYNGFTGTYYDNAIFLGSTYRQRLAKFILDDKNSVPERVPHNSITGQPNKGRRGGGGSIRLGTMEVDTMETHGCMFNYKEKMEEHSDGQVIYICRNCCKIAVYNKRRGIYKCVNCGPNAMICRSETRRSATVLNHEINSLNIDFKVIPEKYTFYESK